MCPQTCILMCKTTVYTVALQAQGCTSGVIFSNFSLGLKHARQVQSKAAFEKRGPVGH